MSAEDRQEAIIRAAARVFADKGFHGATTRALAMAAGVSEALLYRHFPSKEALYEAIGLQHLTDQEAEPGLTQIMGAPPSTKRLAMSVEHVVSQMAEPGENLFTRLMTHSLLGDGKFARTALKGFEREFFGFLAESVAAADEAGDIQEGVNCGPVELWLAHHLALGLRLVNLPDRPALAYDCPRFDLHRRATAFILRGMGVKEEAIRRCFPSRR